MVLICRDLGQGTWQMGEDDEHYHREVEGLRYGIQEGIRMLGYGRDVCGWKSRKYYRQCDPSIFIREDLYVVSKVYPQNANRHRIYSSLERSLKLLGTDYLDLYLLHWREDADLAEVVYCMEDLKRQGKIRSLGCFQF